MNKRGILLSQGIRILLAVLSILILIYLGAQLTGIFTKRNAYEQALVSMERLMEEIKLVEEGVKEDGQVFIESPDDWLIFAWPYKDDLNKPKHCESEYCICLCPPLEVNDLKFATRDNFIESCNSFGICEDVNMITKTIYVSAPDESYVKLVKNIVGLFRDVSNVPIDINHPLPVRIKIVEGELFVIK